MMDSNNNILAMKNGDENGNRPLHTVNRTRTDWGQQQHQSTSYESKNVPISVQHQQRRPFQTLNSNTSSIGSSNSDMFRSSSNTTKPLKMAKFHQYTKADNSVAPTRPTNDIADEESSTISANESNTEKCELLQNVFRRRLDAADENMEQFWTIKQASPIDDSEDEETDE